MKKFVQEYFEKAVAKKREHDKKKAERKAQDIESGTLAASAPSPDAQKEDESDGDQDMAMSDDEDEKVKQETATPITPLDQLMIAEGLKRKRDTDDDPDSIKKEHENGTPSKRLKSETPPPPPPPPPASAMPEDPSMLSNEALDNEMSPYNPNGSYWGPPENEDAMREPPVDSGLPPLSLSNVMKNTRNIVDTSAHAHSPDTPTITSPKDESFNQHSSSHVPGQLPEVQVHGGA